MSHRAFAPWLLLVAIGGCDEVDREVRERFRSIPASATTRTPKEVPGDASDDAGPTPAVAPPSRPRSFREAKDRLRAFYGERTAVTIYSRCPLEAGQVDWSRCCLTRDAIHRSAIEWEHVVPAADFGSRLREWREGHPHCEKRGKAYRGRKCAREVSPRFQRIEGDMHNLFPELGDVNGARGDDPMTLVPNPSGRHPELAGCGLRFGNDAVEPQEPVRGDVARAYLYMSAAYPDLVVLDAEARATYVRWHEADPPDALERARNAMIRDAQGNGNPWIE